MLVAAVDCATLTLSCALAEVGEGEVTLLADRTERAEPSGRGGHSARLPGALVELLGLLERRLPDVEGYAVGLGPGSFTGLRIGLATWKGLAYANRRPIAGVSSLAAMALDAAGAAPAGAVLVPLLDARKGEVYCGFYRAAGGRVEPVEPEAALGPVALLERVASLRRGGAEVLGFGEGFGAYRDVLAGPLAPLEAGPGTPGALAVARLAAEQLRAATFDPQSLYALEPHYVRPSEAEIKYPQGLGPGAKA